jgi:glc operon protein GlcG
MIVMILKKNAFSIFLMSACLIWGSAQAQAPAAASAPTNPLDTVPEKMPFDISYGSPINLERAQNAIKAAVTEAKKRGWKLNIAVVDSGGHLVAFERMDGALIASVPISEHKARASAHFKRETKVFENGVQLSNFNYLMTIDGVIASRGGIPLIEGGKLIGAIGCSGATGSQDEVVCKAGADTVKP